MARCPVRWRRGCDGARILELGAVLLAAAAAGWLARRASQPFSFVLATVGLTTGALGLHVCAAILGAVALTIALSTVIVRLIPGRGVSASPEGAA
jgi:hypothetical protein